MPSTADAAVSTSFHDPGLAESHPALGIYVHFPWCLHKCPYCDFLSIPEKREAIRHTEYADAVLAELSARAAWLGPRTVQSVFFGGGTPSLWSPAELGRVLSGISERFDLTADAEITVECNPSSFDRHAAEALRAIGVNRVSLGVQSLNDARLRFLERLHDAQLGLDAVRAAVAAGFPRVSADLIFAVHGQTVAEAIAEARTVVDLGITHLSSYALTIESGTAFGALHRKGQLPLLEEDTAAHMFVDLSEALQQLGFEHYEISNYATAGHYSKHNLGYWTGREYLGLGCGAWGTVRSSSVRSSGVRRGSGGLRYRNTQGVDRYLSNSAHWSHTDLDLGESNANGSRGLIDHKEELDGPTLLKERIMLGLRLRDGLDVERAAADCAATFWTPARKKAVARLVERGRLAQQGSRIWVPKNAWLFCDGTVRELL